MTHSDSSAAMVSSGSPRVRRQLLFLALATLALAMVVAGIWVRGRSGPAAALPVTGVQQMDDHALPAHVHSESHAAAPSAVDHDMGGMSGDMTGMSGDMAGMPADHNHSEVMVEPAAHEHGEPSAPAGAQAPAHAEADAHAEHEMAGHGVEAAAVSAPTRQIVLSGFAGVNALVILAAGILRRRSAPRLPKHLQRQPSRVSS